MAYKTKMITTIDIDEYERGVKFTIPYPVPYGMEGKFGKTYSVDDGSIFLICKRGARVFVDGVEHDRVISINPIEKWILCGTGKFNKEKEEFVNYRINGVVTWEAQFGA